MCLPSSCLSLLEETALIRAFASYCPSASTLGGEVPRLHFRCATGYFAAAEKQSCLHSVQRDSCVILRHRCFHPCTLSFSEELSPAAAFASACCFSGVINRTYHAREHSPNCSPPPLKSLSLVCQHGTCGRRGPLHRDSGSDGHTRRGWQPLSIAGCCWCCETSVVVFCSACRAALPGGSPLFLHCSQLSKPFKVEGGIFLETSTGLQGCRERWD